MASRLARHRDDDDDDDDEDARIGVAVKRVFIGWFESVHNIVHGVQIELDQFGVFINKDAKVDVAEARYKGDVDEAESKGNTRAENVRIEAQTVIAENKRQVVIRDATVRMAALILRVNTGNS
ncbi:hypothetical protein HK405_002600 [Cladochytrium tenue]|nr:hypothetical protein HK405_002600 [Cladochytrium tenue]